MKILVNEIRRIAHCLIIAMGVSLIFNDHTTPTLLTNFIFAVGGSFIGERLAK